MKSSAGKGAPTPGLRTKSASPHEHCKKYSIKHLSTPSSCLSFVPLSTAIYSTATPNGSIQSDKHKTPPNQKLKKTVPSTINCHEFMVIARQFVVLSNFLSDSLLKLPKSVIRVYGRLGLCRVPIGTHQSAADNHRTATSACTVFLRDIATSRHSPNKFGSALDFRNFIHISPLRGDL